MRLLQILVLAIIQGAAELLPVSSSAHVIVAEKLMGLDPTTPQMTLLLVMLHTGTMFAVIVYFWKAWRATYFASMQAFRTNVIQVVIGTVATGIIGLILLLVIKDVVAHNAAAFQIEDLFGDSRLIAVALAAAGLLILVSSRFHTSDEPVSLRSAAWIGAVQGLCLPFRGFSRSGATISTGLMLRISRQSAEEFSFALAVVLTPVAIAREVYRLYEAEALTAAVSADGWGNYIGQSLLAMTLSFLAGLVALRWLSRWLEQGH